MRISGKENARLVIYPYRSAWSTHTVERDIADLGKLIPEIKRHCDVRGQRIEVDWDVVHRCSSCEYAWAEDSPFFNGGCCDDDAAVILAMTEEDALFWGLHEQWEDWR